MLIGVVISTLLVTRWYGRRYIEMPLVKLSHAANSIAKGDLSVRPVKTSNDEIGDVVESFESVTKVIDLLSKRLTEQCDSVSRGQLSVRCSSDELEGEFAEIATKVDQLIDA